MSNFGARTVAVPFLGSQIAAEHCDGSRRPPGDEHEGRPVALNDNAAAPRRTCYRGRVRTRLVIFDFDGTLADTWRDIATALNHALREAGWPIASDAQVREWIGHGITHLIERALPEPARSGARIAAIERRFRAHYAGCCLDTTVLYPGIAECVAQLSAHTLAVLSNKPDEFLFRMLDALGLAGRFAAVVGGDTTPAHKPDPAAVAHVVRAAGARPDELWMVGDSALDVATGRAAGARTIGCAWGLRGAAELRAAQAEFVVDHARDIPPIIGTA